MHENHSEKKEHSHSHHYILPDKLAIAVGGALIFLTVVTVWVAHVDLGPLNIVVALLVASVKASLVALIFMNLRNDKILNGMTFVTSFLFLAIFIVLTSTDLFFRGNVYVKGPLLAATKSTVKFKKAWESTPELVAFGKKVFENNCASCHGDTGQGNGPAAGALNPKPRNFTQAAGWKNGRKPSEVFGTVTKGIPGTGMSSFSGVLPPSERWAVVHYVLSLGPAGEKDSAADLAKVGVDPNQESSDSAEKQAPSVPVEIAMAHMAVAEPQTHTLQVPSSLLSESMGAQIYQNQCMSCHGSKGEGGIKVRTAGLNPRAYVVTHPFFQSETLRSYEAFSARVARGLPGDLMPGNGQLTTSEMKELYDTVKKFGPAQ